MIKRSQAVTALPPSPDRFAADAALQKLLWSYLSPPAMQWVTPVLKGTADLAPHLDEWAALADKNPPRLHARDRFGNRTDRVEFHPAYRELQEAAYGGGIVGHYYDAQVRGLLGEGLEVAKFAHGYIFGQSEQGLFCPICLTDGTAYVIERFGSDAQKLEYLPRLTSHDMQDLWEGAMYLTEKAGGSDVGACEMTARRSDSGAWTLHGEKWFCSNAAAQVALVLARPEGAESGTRGLGLFLVKRHAADGSLNGMRLERLKDKLGTRSMPTGEYVFDGARAEAVGDVERGFLQMAQMVNLSRLYNATASLAVVRRMLTESLRWASARHAFGRPLDSFPMVRASIVEMAVEHEASMHLLFSTIHRRGRVAAEAEDTQLLRLMTPLVKYHTAKLAVRSTSETMELHGGNGYIEDWPIARFYRDAQVLPIWEGAGNVLVLDAFRAMKKEHAHEGLFAYVRRNALGDAGVGAAVLELEATLPQLFADTESPSCRIWCERAVQVYQAAALMAAASDSRSQAVADTYVLKYFGKTKDSLHPAHLAHAVSHFEEIVGAT